MNNEEVELQETADSSQDASQAVAKKSGKKWVIWVIVAALVLWFFNSTSNDISDNEIADDKYSKIADQAVTNFFQEFDSGEIYSNAIVYLDETITATESVRIQENIDLALQYLHEPLSTTTFDIRIFDDYQALKKDMLNMTPVSMKSSVNEELSSDGVFGENKDCEIPGSVGITYDEGWFRPRIFILTECAWEEDDSGNWLLTDPEVIAHEIAHVAQNDWYGSSFYTWACFVPKWMTEGQAQFVSAQLASLGKGFDYKHFRKSWMYWDPNGKVEPDEDYESKYGAYSDGAFAFEYLIGKYGWDKFETLVSKMNIYPNYKCETADIHKRLASAFKVTYGYSLKKFYAEVEDYISWNMAELDFMLN